MEQKIEPPYGPGAICETCGHFASRHDKDGCHGVDPEVGCRYGKRGTDKHPVQCKVFLWQGLKYPEPWTDVTVP
jgi:hypothetical protein